MATLRSTLIALLVLAPNLPGFCRMARAEDLPAPAPPPVAPPPAPTGGAAAPAAGVAPALPAAVFARAKPAIALLRRRGGTGTAFCIDPTGLFFTTWKSMEGAEDTVTLDLNPGAVGDLPLSATVLHSDRESNLAVIKVTAPAALPALSLHANGAPLGAAIWVPGYPAPARGMAPSALVVQPGRISTFQETVGGIATYQVDALMGPGYTGSPVLNERGEVVGIVEAGYPESRVHSVIPASRIARFLSSPVIHLEPTGLLDWQFSIPQEFRIMALRPTAPAGPLTVRLVIHSPGGDRSVAATPSGGGAFTVHLTLAPPRKGPSLVDVSATAGDVRVSFAVPDQNFTFAGVTGLLSAVASLEPRTVRLTDGRTLTSTDALHLPVEATLGGQKMTIDLGSFTHVAIAPVQEGPGPVKYTVVVRQADTIIGQQDGVYTVRREASPNR